MGAGKRQDQGSRPRPARRGPEQWLQTLRKVLVVHLCETGEHRVSEAEEKARGRLAGVAAGLEGLRGGDKLAGKSLDLVIGTRGRASVGPGALPGSWLGR